MKVCMPSSAHAGIQHPSYGRIDGRRGVVDLPDKIASDLIRFDGCFPAADKPRGVVGFRCTDCGFEGYFRTCGRCGGTCTRPGETNGETHQA